jgi:hypothetical protein
MSSHELTHEASTKACPALLGYPGFSMITAIALQMTTLQARSSMVITQTWRRTRIGLHDLMSSKISTLSCKEASSKGPKVGPVCCVVQVCSTIADLVRLVPYRRDNCEWL